MLSTCQKSRERSASERGGIGKKAKSHQFQMNRLLAQNPMRDQVAYRETEGPEQAHSHKARALPPVVRGTPPSQPNKCPTAAEHKASGCENQTPTTPKPARATRLRRLSLAGGRRQQEGDESQRGIAGILLDLGCVIEQPVIEGKKPDGDRDGAGEKIAASD